MSLFPKFQITRDPAAILAIPAIPAEVVEIQVKSATPAIPAIPAIRRDGANRNSENSRNSNPSVLKQKNLSAPTRSGAPTLGIHIAEPASTAVAANPAVTAPLPTRTEEPEPKERRCAQCAHFDRSPYGYPLGLCQQHGNRVQHSTSQPTRFGCCYFVIRPPADDSKTCLACCHYRPLSTMCDVVNTGCPYPAISPCRGDSFEPKEVRS